MTSFTSDRVSVSFNQQIYLLIHNAAADLSILSDFNEFKESLDLVNRCFVTLSSPIDVDGVEVKVRDTQLLTPGGGKSLHALSNLYPGLGKLKIAYSDISDMESFWDRDPNGFREYAMRDALITLVHGCRMSVFNLELGGLGVPVTLSALSGRFLKRSWMQSGYKGYQISPKYLIGDTASLQTPKGLFSSGSMGLKIGYFIGNYKGGRNECFMYGCDDDTL